jgi:hypothetical protein
MFSILSLEGNANQNNTGVLSYCSQYGYHQENKGKKY